MATMTQTTSKSLARDPVALGKIVEEVFTLVRSAVDKHGRSLVPKEVALVNTLGDVPIIEADARKCTQVFYNLVTNACKFTVAGSITASSRIDPKGEFVEIAIGDTGQGIARENLERIFKPCEQEDNSNSRCHDGVGL